MRLALQTGLDDVVATARDFGIGARLRPFPAIALGAFELSPVELLTAYATLANRGVRPAVRLVDGVAGPDGHLIEGQPLPPPKRAVSPETAYVVTSLSADGFTADTGIRGGRQEGAEATAEDLALTARVDWVPVQGLLVGAAIFTGDTAQAAAGLDGARMTQYEAHVDWRFKGVQARALLARTSLDDAGAVSAVVGETVGSRQEGYYAEAG